MSWFDTVPVLLGAMVLIFVPGAFLARVLGARGITWLAVSAPLSMSLIGAGAIVAQMLNVRWTPLTLLVVTVASAVVAWVIRYVIEIRRKESVDRLWAPVPIVTTGAVIGGLLIAGVVLGQRITQIFITPQNISQTYDNVFHLNAVRYILDTGRGSSLRLAGLGSSDSPAYFYPAVWHDLIALVSQLTGASLPVSINVSNLVLGALVWTISCMFLATRVLGNRPAVFLLTGALAGAFSAFPYLLLGFGVLYPNFLAVTLLPVGIGLVLEVLQLSSDIRPGWIRGGILLIAAAPGLALSHPSIAFVLGAFALPLLAAWLAQRVKAVRSRDIHWAWLVAALVGTICYVLVFAFVWEKFRPSEKASFWPPRQTIAQALGEGVANAPMGGAISWLVVILTLLGIYGILRSKKHLWLLGLVVVSVGLYVVVSGFVAGPLRSSITGVFYNDSYRLAALLPVVGIIVAVYGAVWLFDQLRAKFRLDATESTPKVWAATMAVGLVATLLVAWSAQDNSIDNATAGARSAYKMTDHASLLSTDESALLDRAGETIPEDATVIANPATGASLIYALENRRVLLPAVSSIPTAQESLLLDHLAELGTNPEVCAAVVNLESYYILDFGSLQINNMNKPFPTSEELAAAPGLTMVDHEGAARLYRIDVC